MPNRVNIERRKLILNDFFKVEEVYLSYERFDGSMSPLVRRLIERGDSVAALLHHKERNSILLVNQFYFPPMTRGLVGSPKLLRVSSARRKIPKTPCAGKF